MRNILKILPEEFLDFRHTEINDKNYFDVVLPPMNFENAILTKCRFSNVYLNASFKGATLNNVIFTNCIVDASFEQASLERCIIKKSDFTESHFDKAVFNWIKIKRSNFDGCSFFKSMIHELEIYNSSLDNTNFDLSYIIKTKISNTGIFKSTLLNNFEMDFDKIYQNYMSFRLDKMEPLEAFALSLLKTNNIKIDAESLVKATLDLINKENLNEEEFDQLFKELHEPAYSSS